MISKPHPEMQQTYWDPPCRVWPQTQDQVLPLPPWANHSPVSGDMTWTLGGSDGQTSLCQSVYKEMGEDKDFDLDTERPNAVRREPLTWTSYWIPSEPLLSLQWYFWKRKDKKKHAFHAATVNAVECLRFTSLQWHAVTVALYTWPVSVVPGCAASSFPVGPIGPTAGPSPLCYALYTYCPRSVPLP